MIQTQRMKKRFKDVYRDWMAAKHLNHIDAARHLGISRAVSFQYAAGTTPPKSKIPLLAERMAIQEWRLTKLITSEKAHNRKPVSP